MAPRYLVTGGTGFLGSALVRRLLAEGIHVRVLDDDSRGSVSRLADVATDIELVKGDVRDADSVRRAATGCDTVCHLAYVNGTELFYEKPDVVLDVAVRGMLSVIDAASVTGGNLLLVSSSEVYQEPPAIPTPEDVPLVVPDVHNARYSYGGGKIISELLALHSASRAYDRVVIVRPHNVYGPQMGYEHVIPQFTCRVHEQISRGLSEFDFPIQGTGQETRAFTFVDDFIDGTRIAMTRGEHNHVYHVGSDVEIPISALAHEIADVFGATVHVRPGPLQPGSPARRCPDISKLRVLGFEPTTPIQQGLTVTCEWYRQDLESAQSQQKVA